MVDRVFDVDHAQVRSLVRPLFICLIYLLLSKLLSKLFNKQGLYIGIISLVGVLMVRISLNGERGRI